MFEHMKKLPRPHGLGRTVAEARRAALCPHLHAQQVGLPFVARDETDWMARYFFTGPDALHELLMRFQEHLSLVEDWKVNGTTTSERPRLG